MKKLLLLLLLLPLFASAQMLIDKKDDFTGKRVKGAVVFFGKTLTPQPITLVFGLNGDRKFIAFTWNAQSGPFGAFNNMNVSALSLLFKMDNDSIMKYKADTSLSKIVNVGSSSIMAFGSYISDDDLIIFSNHLIKKFRVGIRDDNGVDMDGNYMFTDRNKDQVQKGAAFMLDMQIIKDDQ